jgi:uncharacterized membrane protein YgdD (TMEM256/DUF423 family)
MKQKIISIAAISGAISVILGALAAHQLKSVLSESSLDAFDKGVRYQMYHSLFLLFIGLMYKDSTAIEIKRIAYITIAGILLFSFSIYLLSTQSISGLNLSFLGPITPLGGIALITAWIMLAIQAKKIVSI